MDKPGKIVQITSGKRVDENGAARIALFALDDQGRIYHVDLDESPGGWAEYGAPLDDWSAQ